MFNSTYIYLQVIHYSFSERNELIIHGMQALDDHEALRSRSYMIVVLGLNSWYQLGEVCVHIYANMYMLIAVCSVHQNLVGACLYAFLMYAFLEDVWFSSVLK